MTKGTICINKIFLENTNGRTRLIFDVTENGQPKQVFLEVEEKYGEYLCHERCDAIVIGLLSYAMRKGYDIKSETPITEALLYNLNEYLIPVLTKHDAKLTAIKIDVPTAEAMPNAGAVGTGISCGVDSFHTILSHYNTPYKNHNLTHLVINNVGAFNVYERTGMDVKKDCYDKARIVARELDLPLIETDSNFQVEFAQRHLYTLTYSSMFPVYCLQKLWKIYYHASDGNGVGYLKLENNSDDAASYYELFSTNYFSTNNLRVYSSGAACNRLEKIARISDNKIVQENLHVCTMESHNCGRCSKCRRTILGLYAVNKLDKFNKVFDIEYFNNNKKEYLRWLCSRYLQNDVMNEPTYHALKHEIGTLPKLVVEIRRRTPKFIRNSTPYKVARALKLKVIRPKP